MAPEPLLPAESLERYADAIVGASLVIEEGETLVVQGEPEHRELLVAVANAVSNTLLDKNAAAHIAFGSGFGGTRSETPARGINRSVIHLDVMIGSPKLEVTGFDARGRRIPLLREGAWQI
jgi:leucyl aminopeptidase (aminopeptidase T)